MAELVPSDGEQFERIDEGPCAWDIPHPKNDDGIHDGLRWSVKSMSGVTCTYDI